jgi:hypothetical protein
MDRAVVRSVQVFFTVFVVLAVITASGRSLLADGADTSALGMVNVLIGDLLVLFVALGLIWVLPNRVMRVASTPEQPVNNIAGTRVLPKAEMSGAGDAARARHVVKDSDALQPTAAPGATSSATSQAQRVNVLQAWSVGRMILVAALPAVLILAVGVVLYFR